MNSHFSNMAQFFYLLEKAKYFCGKNLSTKEFWHEFQRLSSWLSTSLDLHIPSNFELILEKWQLGSSKKMKYLESHLLRL